MSTGRSAYSIRTTTTSTTAPLQCTQNDTARLVDRRAHITPALKQLHWLLVPYRLQFKVATLMHHVYHRYCPQYLVNPVSFTTNTAGQRLRSTATRASVSVRTRTNLGRRAFSVASPSVWNSLLSLDNHKQFRHILILHFHNFNLATFYLSYYIYPSFFYSLTKCNAPLVCSML